MSVFSEFELREFGIKTKGKDAYSTANCVGSIEEEMNAKVVTKKCRGVVVKTIVKGDGTGTLKITMHIPYEIYTEMYGMNVESLIEGVKAYGRNSKHEGFSCVGHVFDEDDIEKYKAYPNCILQKGIARKIENGAEEVAEIELEVSLMPDEYGNGLYEALAADLSESIKAKWMTEFEPSLVQVATV